MCFWQKARYDTRESTFSEDCEFFQCQGEPRPRLRFPEKVAHRLCPDGHDQPPMPTMPSSSIIHVSGGICAPTGRQPGLHCGVAGAVVGEAGWRFLPRAFHLPSLPCRGWSRAAGDSTLLYRQNLLSTIWPLGRQVPAGRWAARNLQALRRGFLQKSCRRRKVVQVLGGGCSCFTVIIALLQQLSLNRSRVFLALKTQDLAAFSSLGGVLFTAKVL